MVRGKGDFRMKKKVLAMLLLLVMIIGLIPTSTIFALPSSTAVFMVKADKTQAKAGDVINYSVEIQQTGKLNTLEATICIPEGLTLVPGSLTTIERSVLGWDDFGFNEDDLLFSGFGSISYEETEPIVVANFKCTVDEDSVGKYKVTLIDYVADDEEYESKNPTVVGAEVDVIVPSMGVSLDKDTLLLNTGNNKSAALVANVSPENSSNKDVTWKSSDETIATVVNGVVTAVKHGAVIITVTTVDGGFTDICEVTINCSHVSKTFTSEKNANCQEGGWSAYYTCDECGKLFDSNGTTGLNTVPVTNKDDTKHTNIQYYEADTSTCVHQGHDAYKKCMDCGVVTEGTSNLYYGEHNYGILNPAVDEKHTINELLPTIDAHYKCSVCYKYFTEAKVETTLENLTGITPVHSYGNWINTDDDKHWKECICGSKSAVEEHEYDNACDVICNICGHIRTATHFYSSTWSTDGTKHWKECMICHVAKTEEGTHTGGTATCKDKKVCTICHSIYGDYSACNYVENVKTEYLKSIATCVKKAVYKKSCFICGKAHETETFVSGGFDKNNHIGETELKELKPVSCDESGYTGDIWCKDCNKKIKTGETLPASHKLAEVPAQDATHEKNGNIMYYNCLECTLLFADKEAKDELGAEDVLILKGEHSYEKNYKKDEDSHWQECSCGDRVCLETHTYGEWNVTKESTTIEHGLQEKYCFICGHVVTEKLPFMENTNISLPQTGDTRDVFIWIMFFGISASGVVVVSVASRKKKEK